MPSVFFTQIIQIVFQYASKELECLKNAMEDLTKIQAELAEFFCEDPKSFRLEECYKAFLQFNNNFKKAVVDNEKRREQEKSAEQRRLQRETEQAKRRSGSFQGTQWLSISDSPRSTLCWLTILCPDMNNSPPHNLGNTWAHLATGLVLSQTFKSEAPLCSKD